MNVTGIGEGDTLEEGS